MSAEIIYGKEIAEQLREEMKLEVSELKNQNITPGLAVVIVGSDPASMTYVRSKKKASHEIGINSSLIELPSNTSEDELLGIVQNLNNDDSIHGILVQLPLPKHINENAIIEAILPEKDVDGFHPINVGRLLTGQEALVPCTPLGILKMIQLKNIQIEGKNVVIVGRSNIVGKPMGHLLLNENATVTYCHSRTKNLQHFTKQADIIVVAVGKAHLITGDHIKEGAVVIDVGIHRLDNGKLTGDVEFESAKEKASYITPVPKGVGPMTITMLLHNTIVAAKRMNNATEGSLSK